MIKYLGSKRRLVGVLAKMTDAVDARTALDLFTGTTRVAQAFKSGGVHVTAVDTARYSEVFARCYIETDAGAIDHAALARALAHLQSVPPRAGYVTETFCQQARYFRPENGERIDAIRETIEAEYAGCELYPILLTSLLEAADRVDSTTGLQMAFLKQWAPRALRPLTLSPPALLPGGGRAIRGDATEAVSRLGSFDVAYLDPPYNQHRYFTNYHVWETLVAWDAPDHYGVACKRTDARDESTKSRFNRKGEMPSALARCVSAVDADLVIISYNNEAWLSLDDLRDMCAPLGAVEVVAFDSKRYVGAQIGIHDRRGQKVGEVSHLRNLEYLVIAGEASAVARAAGTAKTSAGAVATTD